MTDEQIDALIDRHYRHKNHPDSYTALRATIRDALSDQAAELATATRALEHVRQQAGIWKQEARTQKSTVDEVGAALGGIPDWGPVVETVSLMVAALAESRAEVERLTKERDHWKANHDNRVEAARVLIEREDMPLERISAYGKYVAALDLAAQAPKAGEWQPIETAPKDGTGFLGYWPTPVHDCSIHAIKWHRGRWWETNEDYPASEPTHWMPLPAAPAAATEREK